MILFTGELMQGELYSAIKREEEQTDVGEPGSTSFSGEMHFYELVEDTKDGIWLVQVGNSWNTLALCILMLTNN